jgi:hypothetical protein
MERRAITNKHSFLGYSKFPFQSSKSNAARARQRLQGMNDDERRAELKRIAEFLAKKKGRKLRVTDNTTYPMQSSMSYFLIW